MRERISGFLTSLYLCGDTRYIITWRGYMYTGAFLIRLIYKHVLVGVHACGGILDADADADADDISSSSCRRT